MKDAASRGEGAKVVGGGIDGEAAVVAAIQSNPAPTVRVDAGATGEFDVQVVEFVGAGAAQAGVGRCDGRSMACGHGRRVVKAPQLGPIGVTVDPDEGVVGQPEGSQGKGGKAAQGGLQALEVKVELAGEVKAQGGVHRWAGRGGRWGGGHG